jgi:small subunit ribosomal protein S18
MSSVASKFAFAKILGNIKRLQPQESYLPRDLNDLWNSALERPKRFDDRKIKQDAIKAFDINPKREYRNVGLLNRFITKMGLIKNRRETGLTEKNQKQISKAIRRARSMGLMPFTFRNSYSSRDDFEFKRFKDRSSTR